MVIDAPRRRCRLGVLLGALSLTATMAVGQEPSTTLGTLTCSTAGTPPGAGASPSSTADVVSISCAFQATTGGHEEAYVGTMASPEARQSIGGKLVLVWAVIGPKDSKLEPGLLAQQYVSGSRQDAAPPRSPPALIGQGDGQITLQRVVNGPSGGNLDVTALELRLKATPA